MILTIINRVFDYLEMLYAPRGTNTAVAVANYVDLVERWIICVAVSTVSSRLVRRMAVALYLQLRSSIVVINRGQKVRYTCTVVGLHVVLRTHAEMLLTIITTTIPC